MFNKIKSLAVKADSTAVFVFDKIEGEPSLVVRPSTEANKNYLNAVLAEGKRLSRKLRGKLTVEFLEENRARDAELFPKHVAVRWEKPAVLDDGSPAQAEHIGDFLRAIPPEMFDELRSFCGDSENFRQGDAEDVVGN